MKKFVRDMGAGEAQGTAVGPLLPRSLYRSRCMGDPATPPLATVDHSSPGLNQPILWSSSVIVLMMNVRIVRVGVSHRLMYVPV